MEAIPETFASSALCGVWASPSESSVTARSAFPTDGAQMHHCLKHSRNVHDFVLTGIDHERVASKSSTVSDIWKQFHFCLSLDPFLMEFKLQTKILVCSEHYIK